MPNESIVVDPTAQAPAAPAAPKLEDLRVPAEMEGIDARYKGKSVKDIIDMHTNAEAALGNQGRELGVWRNLVSELSTAQATALQSRNQQQSANEEALTITSDQLLSDPAGSIAKVVERSIERTIKPLADRQDLSAKEDALRALNADFPQMSAWGNDPGFQAWAVKTGSRRADSQAAQKGDLAAARRLLENWEERVELTKPQTNAQTMETGTPQGLQGARAAQTERGGAGGGQVGATYSQAQLVDMIIKNPDEYRSDGFQAKLKQAIKEGRMSQ